VSGEPDPIPSSTDIERFRADVAAWLARNCPVSMRTPVRDVEEIAWGGRKALYANPEAKLWLERMAGQGWTCPSWPREYGGAGLDPERARVLGEELVRIGARTPLFSFGLSMLGPVLLEFGTEEQKREHLPPIARGEIRWCQGYSEPGAGSDLASLETRCEDRRDHYVVSGQKVWTSYADRSDWMFCLVRMDPQASKREGIGFVLIDMDQPGIAVSPIRLISGASPFCQVFLDGARAEKRNLVGPPDGGWTIAKRLLEHERRMLSGLGFGPAGEAGSSVADLAGEFVGYRDGRLADPVLRDAIARERMDTLAFRATLRRAADEAKAGRGSGAVASILKLYGSELSKRRWEVMMAALGTQGIGWEGEADRARELALTRGWLRSKAQSIEGGTSEIQLNVIARRVLGLPS
jgi:acyl-CoA dehydrogenase